MPQKTRKPFFFHHPSGAAPDAVKLSEATRLMCAGVYLDENYAKRAH
jgi:hypothetical protein